MSKPQEMTLTDEQLKLAEKLLKEKRAAAKQKETVGFVPFFSQDTYGISCAVFVGAKKTAEVTMKTKHGVFSGVVFLDEMDLGMPQVVSKGESWRMPLRSYKRGTHLVFSTVELAREAIRVERENDGILKNRAMETAKRSLEIAMKGYTDSLASLESDLAAIAKMEPVN